MVCGPFATSRLSHRIVQGETVAMGAESARVCAVKAHASIRKTTASLAMDRGHEMTEMEDRGALVDLGEYGRRFT